MKKYAKIRTLLSKLGLAEKEVSVYLALLKFGEATVAHISKESGVARTHIYNIAEELRKKGILSMLDKEGVRHYRALSHPELVAFIKRKSEDLESLGKEVGEAASDFESMRQNIKQPTKVEFFSGVDGVMNIYDRVKADLIKIKRPFELLTIFSPEKLENSFPGGWFDQKKYIDIPFMTKRDIVHESEVFTKHLAQRSTSPNTYLYKIWPKKEGEFPVDTLCWENKIAFIELSEYPSGTIIENEALVKTFRMWFEKMWQNLQ